MATLTDAQKDRICHFLGYPRFSQLAQSIQLGYPAATQPMFLVLDAFHRITPGGVDSILRDLCECESIEAQLSSARGRMKAESVGQVTLNAAETKMLRSELMYWTKRLADDLGVNVNPYSQMSWLGMQDGVNAKVSG